MNGVQAKRYAAELARREVSVPDYYGLPNRGPSTAPAVGNTTSPVDAGLFLSGHVAGDIGAE
jgi:hypothetical protein